MLAYLRNATTYVQFAAGFGIGTSTLYRYIAEAVDLVAELAQTFREAARAAARTTYALLDGTLPPFDRIAADQPFSRDNTRSSIESGLRSAYYVAALLYAAIWLTPASNRRGG